MEDDVRNNVASFLPDRDFPRFKVSADSYRMSLEERPYVSPKADAPGEVSWHIQP